MSVSHLSSMDLFPSPCNTSGFLPEHPVNILVWGGSSKPLLKQQHPAGTQRAWGSPSSPFLSKHHNQHQSTSISFPWKLLKDCSAWQRCGQVQREQSLWGALPGADCICTQLWDQCISWLAFLLLRKDQWRKDQLKKDRWWPDKPLIHKKRDFAWRNRTLPWGSSSDLIVPMSYTLTWILPAINCQPCKDRVRVSPLLHRAAHRQSSWEAKQERGKSQTVMPHVQWSPAFSQVGIPHMLL